MMIHEQTTNTIHFPEEIFSKILRYNDNSVERRQHQLWGSIIAEWKCEICLGLKECPDDMICHDCFHAECASHDDECWCGGLPTAYTGDPFRHFPHPS